MLYGGSKPWIPPRNTRTIGYRYRFSCSAATHGCGDTLSEGLRAKPQPERRGLMVSAGCYYNQTSDQLNTNIKLWLIKTSAKLENINSSFLLECSGGSELLHPSVDRGGRTPELGYWQKSKGLLS